MPASALIVAVEHTAIPVFGDRPGLIGGAERFARWLVDPAGGGLERSRVWMACAPALDRNGAFPEYQPPDDLRGVNVAGPPTREALKAAAADIAAGSGHGELVLYWAGHGVIELLNDSLHTVALADDARATLRSVLITLDAVVEPVGTVAVVDTCQNLANGHGYDLGDYIEIGSSGHSAQLPEKLAVFYACSENESAFTTREGAGRFTAAVVDKLIARRAQRPAGTWLSAAELYWLRDQLVTEVERLGQRPKNLMKGWSADEIIARSPLVEYLSTEEWQRLLSLAEHCDGRVPRHILQRVHADALPAGTDPPVKGTVRLDDYIKRIAALGRESADRPPHVFTYLYTLTRRRSDIAQVADLRQWLDAEMDWWNWRYELDTAYRAMEAELAERNNDGFYLVVRIRPGEVVGRRHRQNSAKRYVYRVGLFHRDQFWWVAPHDKELLSVPEIRQRFSKLLSGIRTYQKVEIDAGPVDAEPVVLSDRDVEELTVEFLVPRTLLGHDFAGWRLPTGFEIGAQHAVVLRDGDRWWDKEPDADATRKEIRQHAKILASTGAKLADISTSWVTCAEADKPTLDAHVPRAPYIAFAFPALKQIGADLYKFRPTKPLEAALNMGAVAALWPALPCAAHDVAPAPGGASGTCNSTLLRADYERAIKDPDRDLRPRFFVHELRNEPHATLGRITLFYDDGTRTLEGKPLGTPEEH